LRTILVTGSAGFIGFHTIKRLLELGNRIIGIDNFNDYYDVNLKLARNKILEENNNFKLYKTDLTDFKDLKKVFEENKLDVVMHFAAQPGIRLALKNPFQYDRYNNLAPLNILELMKDFKVKKLVFASSSSVYGGNTRVPFSEEDRVDKPVSMYAATKKYNELLVHAYHKLYGIKAVGLRFFTVYGPYGRPDMAPYKFTDLISKGKTIDVYNHGKMSRDFTYISDIVDGIVSAWEKDFDFEIFNIGNSKTVELNYFIECIEKELGKKANKNMMPLQKGDMLKTFADITKSKKQLGYNPKVSIEEGIKKTVEWYKEYHSKNL